MEKEFESGDREFLNISGFHEDATMSYHISVTEKGYFSGTITIRDCGESVHLELDAHSDEWMKNPERKIDIMMRLLRDTKRDLRKARKAVVRAKKK